MKTQNIIFFTLAILSRLIPHPPNLTLMGGYSFWSGSESSRKNSLAFMLFPFVLLLISDYFLGFHEQMPGVYAAYFVMLGLGRVFSSTLMQGDFLKNSAFSVLGTFLFFLISNAWVWWTTYDHTFANLMQSYILALPFIGYSFLGDGISLHLFVTLPARLRQKQLSVDGTL